ncbi:MAG TPA: type II secretion system F family protein [Bryobacteraceae bacterium]|nr:type II secretion system F family protein [Bryobacteraceae bacterium]
MLALSAILVFLTTFLAVALAVLIGWFVLQRMGAEALAEDMSEHLLDESPKLLKNENLSTITLWAKLLERSDFVRIMRGHLLQAGLTWSVGRVTLLMLLGGSIVWAAAMQVERIPGWAGMLMATGVALLPYFYILRRRAKRFRRFEENFPDALDSLARAMRAGHPFAAAMEIAAEECEQPVAAEIRQTAADGNFGTSWNEALNNLSARMPLLEVTMFASAVQLQNRTGGKLNEVLGKLAENMRESTELKGEVRALAAHGKLTGTVLTVLPIVISAVMTVVNPSYLATLIYHPYGKYLISGAIACLVAAHFLIRRIVDIKI